MCYMELSSIIWLLGIRIFFYLCKYAKNIKAIFNMRLKKESNGPKNIIKNIKKII